MSNECYDIIASYWYIMNFVSESLVPHAYAYATYG